MPNIIEQQDLLKSLPDARLAMLLQKPAGDIPPFLVAAEAQRRQTIRQQYGGGAPRESVVDTLTKQLARVPQNIKPEMNTPPQIPPPQMGIAALPQGEPQQMAAGGMVQRYADAGLVKQMSARLPKGALTPSELSVLTPAEVEAYREAQFNADQEPFRRMQERARVTGGRYGQGEAWEKEILENRIDGPFSDWTAPEDVVQAARRLQQLPTDKEIQDIKFPERSGNTEKDKAEAAARTRMPPGTSADPRMSKERVEQIIDEAKSRGATDEQVDEIRKRLEALYAEQEQSDWEKAAKWFAASEQFLDPSKTTMQSLAGAGRAFAEAAGAESRAQREARIEGQKALLQYDIDKRNAEIAGGVRERERTSINAYQNMQILTDKLKSIDSEIGSILKSSENSLNGELTPEAKKMLEDAQARKASILADLSNLQMSAYGAYPNEVYSLNTGFKR